MTFIPVVHPHLTSTSPSLLPSLPPSILFPLRRHWRLSWPASQLSDAPPGELIRGGFRILLCDSPLLCLPTFIYYFNFRRETLTGLRFRHRKPINDKTTQWEDFFSFHFFPFSSILLRNQRRWWHRKRRTNSLNCGRRCHQLVSESIFRGSRRRLLSTACHKVTTPLPDFIAWSGLHRHDILTWPELLVHDKSHQTTHVFLHIVQTKAGMKSCFNKC